MQGTLVYVQHLHSLLRILGIAQRVVSAYPAIDADSNSCSFRIPPLCTSLKAGLTMSTDREMVVL
jgi:hypothetical protein